jgi:hypothetical protein
MVYGPSPKPHQYVVGLSLKNTVTGRKIPAGFFYPFFSAAHKPFHAFHP